MFAANKILLSEKVDDGDKKELTMAYAILIEILHLALPILLLIFTWNFRKEV